MPGARNGFAKTRIVLAAQVLSKSASRRLVPNAAGNDIAVMCFGSMDLKIVAKSELMTLCDGLKAGLHLKPRTLGITGVLTQVYNLIKVEGRRTAPINWWCKPLPVTVLAPSSRATRAKNRDISSLKRNVPKAQSAPMAVAVEAAEAAAVGAAAAAPDSGPVQQSSTDALDLSQLSVDAPAPAPANHASCSVPTPSGSTPCPHSSKTALGQASAACDALIATPAILNATSAPTALISVVADNLQSEHSSVDEQQLPSSNTAEDTSQLSNDAPVATSAPTGLHFAATDNNAMEECEATGVCDAPATATTPAIHSATSAPTSLGAAVAVDLHREQRSVDASHLHSSNPGLGSLPLSSGNTAAVSAPLGLHSAATHGNTTEDRRALAPSPMLSTHSHLTAFQVDSSLADSMALHMPAPSREDLASDSASVGHFSEATALAQNLHRQQSTAASYVSIIPTPVSQPKPLPSPFLNGQPSFPSVLSHQSQQSTQSVTSAAYCSGSTLSATLLASVFPHRTVTQSASAIATALSSSDFLHGLSSMTGLPTSLSAALAIGHSLRSAPLPLSDATSMAAVMRSLASVDGTSSYFSHPSAHSIGAPAQHAAEHAGFVQTGAPPPTSGVANMSSFIDMYGCQAVPTLSQRSACMADVLYIPAPPPPTLPAPSPSNTGCRAPASPGFDSMLQPNMQPPQCIHTLHKAYPAPHPSVQQADLGAGISLLPSPFRLPASGPSFGTTTNNLRPTAAHAGLPAVLHTSTSSGAGAPLKQSGLMSGLQNFLVASKSRPAKSAAVQFRQLAQPRKRARAELASDSGGRREDTGKGFGCESAAGGDCSNLGGECVATCNRSMAGEMGTANAHSHSIAAVIPSLPLGPHSSAAVGTPLPYRHRTARDEWTGTVQAVTGPVSNNPFQQSDSSSSLGQVHELIGGKRQLPQPQSGLLSGARLSGDGTGLYKAGGGRNMKARRGPSTQAAEPADGDRTDGMEVDVAGGMQRAAEAVPKGGDGSASGLAGVRTQGAAGPNSFFGEGTFAPGVPGTRTPTRGAHPVVPTPFQRAALSKSSGVHAAAAAAAAGGAGTSASHRLHQRKAADPSPSFGGGDNVLNGPCQVVLPPVAAADTAAAALATAIAAIAVADPRTRTRSVATAHAKLGELRVEGDAMLRAAAATATLTAAVHAGVPAERQAPAATLRLPAAVGVPTPSQNVVAPTPTAPTNPNMLSPATAPSFSLLVAVAAAAVAAAAAAPASSAAPTPAVGLPLGTSQLGPSQHAHVGVASAPHPAGGGYPLHGLGNVETDMDAAAVLCSMSGWGGGHAHEDADMSDADQDSDEDDDEDARAGAGGFAAEESGGTDESEDGEEPDAAGVAVVAAGSAAASGAAAVDAASAGAVEMDLRCQEQLDGDDERDGGEANATGEAAEEGSTSRRGSRVRKAGLSEDYEYELPTPSAKKQRKPNAGTAFSPLGPPPSTTTSQPASSSHWQSKAEEKTQSRKTAAALKGRVGKTGGRKKKAVGKATVAQDDMLESEGSEMDED